MPSATGTRPTTAEALALLATGELEVVGRIVEASNTAYLVEVVDGDHSALAIYKPVLGERPLWDFPDGTLAQRETACYLLSEAGGWDVVPPTVLRTGPQGTGSVQWWIGDPRGAQDHAVEVVPPHRVREGWLPVLHGEGPGGRPVVVVHEDTARMAEIAVFDFVINNSDRKGSHLLRSGTEVVGVDHGVTLHEEDKLRTVVWGFAGQPLPETELVRLALLAADLEDGPLRDGLEELLTLREVAALVLRVDVLLDSAAYPVPSDGWPSVPWPAM